jgi:hypothetical protein
MLAGTLAIAHSALRPPGAAPRSPHDAGTFKMLHGSFAQPAEVSLVAVRDQPMPPHLACIMYLAVLYFSSFLLILVVRAGKQCATRLRPRPDPPRKTVEPGQPPTPPQPTTVDERLEAAYESLFFVPALCILFLASRIWSLSSFEGELAPWVIWSMRIIVAAIFVEYLLRVLEPSESQFVLFIGKQVFSFFAKTCVHFGAAVIVISMLTSPNKTSLAMQCISLLTAVYFAVHALLAVYKTFVWAIDGWDEIFGTRASRTRGFAQVQHVKETLALFPMLCVLLLSTRMQALELRVSPPQSMQNGMLALSLAATTQVLVVLLQMVLGDRMASFQAVLSAFETACLLTVYVGVGLVFADLLEWDAPTNVSLLSMDLGNQLPTSIKCVTTLSVLYFLVLFSVLVARVIQYVSTVFVAREDYTKGQVEDTMEYVRQSVVFAPMLSMLLIALRLRARTQGQSDPDQWVQTAMVVSVVALLVQATLSPVIYFLTGPSSNQDRSAEGLGTSRQWCAVVVLIGKYITNIIFYVALSVLLFAMW